MDRDEILRRFEAWLDDVLARENPPPGIDAEILSALSGPAAPDAPTSAVPDADSAGDAGTGRSAGSYELWAAMTALTHEIKLQGRAFKELSTTLATKAERAAGELRTLYQDRERQLQRDVERRCQRQMLEPLVELRDRLARGLESARAASVAASASAPRRPWMERLLGGSRRDGSASATAAAVMRGYELGLDHLDRILGDVNVRPIRCQDRPFDPRRMNAVDTEESSIVPEGTVLDVYRAGYEWNGDVFRPAQVKVSILPVSGSHEPRATSHEPE